MNKKPLILLFLFFSLPCLASAQKELLGPLTSEEILKSFPDWKDEAASYWPSQEIIDKLNSISHQVKIEVFLGTWCSDSKRNVSAYLKVMEMGDNPLIQTIYTGLPSEKESRQKYIKGKNIERIPTFIIFVDGKEKGRIVENPIKSIEEDLLEIINR